MITLLVIRFLAAIADALLHLIPSLSVPSWLNGSDSAFGTIFADAGSLSVWFPTALVLAVTAFLLAAYGIGFAMKLARVVLSLFTGGGGSAA